MAVKVKGKVTSKSKVSEKKRKAILAAQIKKEKKAKVKKERLAQAKWLYNQETKKLQKRKVVDIYIRERNTIKQREIRVPWLPASIEYEAGGLTVATYDIINRGEVQVPTGSGLAKISFESQFPGGKRNDKTMLRGKWHKPSHYHKILEYWIRHKSPLNIMVTNYPINKDVYLTAYKCTPAGGFGDMEYSVEFTEDRDITVSATKKKKRKSKTSTTYKVKKGDTLWKIAKKKLGSGKKWKSIYTLNKTIIEKTAKKHGKKSSKNGHWIYPGTKLQLPTTGKTKDKKDTKKGTQYKVIGGALNVRSGPGTTYGVIKTLKNGTMVQISSKKNGWGYADKHKGWLSMQYLKKV